MKFEQFRQTFLKKDIITLDDILIHFPSLDRKQLSRWKIQGRLLHIARGIYSFPEKLPHIRMREQIAGVLVSPSYISLEYALSFYGLIPEEVAIMTLITTKKTQSYDLGEFGRYRYQSIVPRAFIGYEVIADQRGYMATREKAIVDFLYLHADYDNHDAFDEWRINTYEVREACKKELLRAFANIFTNKRLEKQVDNFISYIWV